MANELTAKQQLVLDISRRDYPNGVFGPSLKEMDEFKDLSIQSITATLTSLANKGLMSKVSDVYKDKPRIKFIPVKK